ncbi:MAG: hypothetical protein K6B44_14060 [Lachnospiraceae bacterium]|nr:hypothetical protein [Lachnospiraceae bacterium]
MENKNTYRSPKPLGFILRVLLLAFNMFLVIAGCFSAAKNMGLIKFRKFSSAEDRTFYDSYYYKGQYGSLRDLFYLHNLPDNEVYGKFWEMIRAAEHKNAYDDFSRAKELGYYEGDKAETELSLLEEMAAEPVYPENKEKINALLVEKGE